MDYYERQQDRANNRRDRTDRDDDFAFEQRRQRELDNAAAFYEVADFAFEQSRQRDLDNAAAFYEVADFAFEQRRQRDLDNAVAFYEVAVMMEQFERRLAA